MKSIKVKAYAKINLTLDIVGAENGYHNLESLVASIDIYDLVTVRERKDSSINIYMQGLNCENIPPEKNNAYIAAKRFVERFSTNGADITVEKNIPLGAGLGGSSADAAAVLNGLAALYGISDFQALKEIADSTGSDTGYMLTGGYAVISGRGCEVKKIDCDRRLNLLLCIPPTSVSTPECYKRYDELPIKLKNTTLGAVEALKGGDLPLLGESLSNHLFPAARTLNVDVERAYSKLLEFAPLGVNMSGSGSAVYALCESDEFCRYLASRIRGVGRLIQVKTVIMR